MPFEEPEQPNEQRPDRKLGDEWVDWDGTRQQDDTRTSPWVFVGLAFVMVLLYAGLGWLAIWLIAPRMQALGLGAGVQLAQWVWFGFLLMWFLVLALNSAGVLAVKPWMRWLGGIRWAIAPIVVLGKMIGISRDRIGHAFIRIYNQLEVLPSRIKDPLRLLLLVPRCLSKENMLQLRELKETYGLTLVVALGGTEARKAISEVRPKGIVAVACERDLLVGIKDLRGRIPVLSFCNRRPEGPCKNTIINMPEIEQAVRMFLGNPTN